MAQQNLVQNINDLDNYHFPEGETDDNYIEPSTGFGPPIPGGMQTFRRKALRGWGVTKEGLPSLTIDFEVAEGNSAGRNLAYVRLSSKPFCQGEVTKPNTSQIYNYLRATGYNKPFSSIMKQTGETDEAAAKRLGSIVEAAANRTFKAEVEWDIYCKACSDKAQAAGQKYKASHRRYSQFPLNENGTRNHKVQCGTCRGETVLEARARIERFIPAQADPKSNVKVMSPKASEVLIAG